jgi:hypothetical protein
MLMKSRKFIEQADAVRDNLAKEIARMEALLASPLMKKL